MEVLQKQRTLVYGAYNAKMMSVFTFVFRARTDTTTLTRKPVMNDKRLS